MEYIVCFCSICKYDGAGMDYLVCGVPGRMVKLVWSQLLLFAYLTGWRCCYVEYMAVAMKTLAGTEDVVCVLRILDDSWCCYGVCCVLLRERRRTRRKR